MATATDYTHTYIGARYVPIYNGIWDISKIYEPLTLVLNQDKLYMSLQYVPANINITNNSYWLNIPFTNDVEFIEQYVNAWLDSHPEATTTVEDNSITNAKLIQSGGILSEIIDARNDIFNNIFSSLGENIRKGENDYTNIFEILLKDVLYPKSTFNVLTYSNMVIRRYFNLIYVNGTSSTQYVRLSLYKDSLVTGTRLTPTNNPLFYHNDDLLDIFEIGKKYKCNIKLLKGNYTEDSTVTPGVYIELRDSDGNNQITLRDGATYNCTYFASCIAFGMPLTTDGYQDCLFSISFDEIIEPDPEPEPNPYIINYDLPDYYIDYMAVKNQDIITNINSNKQFGQYGSDVFSFIFITDVHWDENIKHSPALIKNIIENTPINYVICGGDIIAGHADTKQNAVKEIRSFISSIANIDNAKFLNIYGNHDDNSNNNTNIPTIFTKDEQFTLLYGQFYENAKFARYTINNYGGDNLTSSIKNDYYFEDKEKRIRFIGIDWNNPFNTPRQEWLQNILSIDDDYRIVILYHGIYANNGQGELIPEHTNIMPIIEPYKNKIVCFFCGHTHTDNIVHYWNENDGTPIIITGCDKLTDGMIEGTVTEQRFDVVTIDFKNSVIKTVRIGYGENRETSFTIGDI